MLGDKQSKFPNLALMEGLGLDLPLLLQAINDVLVAPANLVGQALETHRVLYRAAGGKRKDCFHVP